MLAAVIYNLNNSEKISVVLGPSGLWRVVTFALHPLAEESLQQAFAELADGGTGVGVDGEGVRDFDPPQDHLLHPDGTAAQQGVTLTGTQEGAMLMEGGEAENREGGRTRKGGEGEK